MRANPAERQRQLQVLSWPFHNGLRNVSLGRGASALAADDHLRSALEQEGWTVTHEEIDPLDESLEEYQRRRLERSRLTTVRSRSTRIISATPWPPWPNAPRASIDTSISPRSPLMTRTSTPKTGPWPPGEPSRTRSSAASAPSPLRASAPSRSGHPLRTHSPTRIPSPLPPPAKLAA